MADDVVLSPGAGGDTIGADEIAAVKYQRVKIIIGANGVNDGDVASGNPLPVTGTVTANAGTNLNTSLLALEAGGNLAAILAKVTVGAASLSKAEDALAGSGDAGVMALVVRADTPAATGADGDYVPLLTDANGRLHVLDQNSAAIKTAVEIMDDWDETDRAKVNLIVGQAGITAGAGSVAANTPRMTHASDDPVTTAVQLIDDTVYTDDTSTHATGTSKGIGVMAVATPTDASVNANDFGHVGMTTDRKLHVAVMDALPAGTANIGDVDVLTVPADPFGVNADAASATGSISAKLRFIAGTGIPITGTVTVGSHAVTNAGTFAVQPGPSTTGGELNYSELSTAAVLSAEIKGSAGQFYDIQGFNKGTAAVYVRMYNQTGAPASTDTANIVWRGIIPGTSGGTGAGFVVPIPFGRTCGTGIGIRVTAAIADNDNTSLNANEVTINVGYK